MITFCRPAQRDLISRPLRLDDFIRTAEALSSHLDDPCTRGDFVETARALVAAAGDDLHTIEKELADLKDEVRELRESNDALNSQVDQLEDQLLDLKQDDERR